MSQTNPSNFSDADVAAAAVAKALAHPARLAILRLLLARQSCVCGEIVLELPLSQSTVSQHLKELKAAGLVQGEVDGPRVCYCIDAAGWARARQLLADALPDVPVKAGACDC